MFLLCAFEWSHCLSASNLKYSKKLLLQFYDLLLRGTFAVLINETNDNIFIYTGGQLVFDNSKAISYLIGLKIYKANVKQKRCLCSHFKMGFLQRLNYPESRIQNLSQLLRWSKNNSMSDKNLRKIRRLFCKHTSLCIKV